MSKWPTALAQEERFDLEKHCVLLGHVGSVSAGTYIPPEDKDTLDDKDLMGIAIPPNEYIMGLKKYEQSDFFHHEWDVVVYDIRKIMNLLIKSNPNVLTLLWLDNRHYVKKDWVGKKLIENRHMFITKALYKSFSGYANGQMIKMERHERNGRMGDKRKQLVEKFGYDTKNAAHLIRLLTMGYEALTQRELFVDRGNIDAAKLVSIKKGEWSLEKVKEEAQKLFDLNREAYIRSTLPDRPSPEAVNSLLMSIMDRIMVERLEGKRLSS